MHWTAIRALNTGGMGTVAPNPYYTPEIAQQCMDTIFLPTIRAMQEEGRPFTGCLYFGLMLTPKGPKVIEYNCRFGDPETQVVLPLLDTDLVDIMLAIWNGTLDQLDIQWKDGCAACVVMASGGYPKKYATGLPIAGLDENGQTANCFCLPCRHQAGRGHIPDSRRSCAGRYSNCGNSAGGTGHCLCRR